MQVLLTPLILALRIVLPGLCWSWCMPAGNAAQGRTAAGLQHLARVLLGGVALNAVEVALLAEAGWFRPFPDLLAWSALCLLGLGLGRRFGPGPALPAGRPAALVLLASAALFALAIWWPGRGAWLMGGWDPGVYQNQAVHVATHGTFRPDPIPVYADLTDEEFAFFTRRFGTYREVFPGIPMDPGSRAYRHYFFRLTPAFTALLYHHGGLEASTRVNLFLAPVAILGLAAMLLALTGSGMTAGLAALVLLASPVFLYHTHIPTSEMLHLVLLAGACWCLFAPGRGWKETAAAAFFLALAVMNRFSFLAFAGLLLPLAAWLDFPRTDRRRCALQHAVLAAAVGTGAAFNLTACAVTLLRLQDVTPRLVTVFAAGVLATAAVDGLATWGRMRKRFDLVLSGLLRTGFALLLLLTLLLFAGLPLPGAGDLATRLAPFLGWPLLVGAAAGGILVFRPGGAQRTFTAWVGFASAVTLALLWSPHIVEVLPWALRRFLPYTLPLLASLNAVWLAALWRAPVPPRLPAATARIAAAMLLVALIGAQSGRALRAWSATEYDGIAEALASVAEQITPDDVIVVDSPQWGTPLALIHGVQVLNGKRLWQENDPETMARGLQVLDRLSGTGRRVRFLTTTPEGLAVYPLHPQTGEPVWESRIFTFSSVVQSARARDFALREQETVFRLYEYE